MIRAASSISRTRLTSLLKIGWWGIPICVLILSGCDHTASFLNAEATTATTTAPKAASVTSTTDPAVTTPTAPKTASVISTTDPTGAMPTVDPNADGDTPPTEGTLPSPSVDNTPSGSLPTPNTDAPSTPPPPSSPLPPGSVGSDPVSSVWGIVGMRGFPYGQSMGSNGNEYHPLFSLDLDFNIWLWRSKRVYAYSDSRFWGQKAAPGITNPSQGSFDFSKREFDFTGGVAWNYYGNWEFRGFAYSTNNLNRGNSLLFPQGFNDGVGLENRYYLNPTYADLGTPAFDKARATFLSIGYYPTKSMVDGKGVEFKPGGFARAYLTLDLYGPKCYLYTDDTFLTDKAFRPAMFNLDSGIAYRPFDHIPRLEFRLGTADAFDLLNTDAETSVYISMRYIF